MSEEVTLQRYEYDYSSGKLKRRDGSKWDFPFVDYSERKTIENGNIIKEEEFCYESLRNKEGPQSHGHNYGHFCIYTHKLRHQTSYENGVRVDKIEKITSRTPGYEEDGWVNRVAWTCTLKNGELTEYSDESGYHASFEKGVPTGDYKMPLDKDDLAFNYSPCAFRTGDDLIDKISIPMIDCSETFNLDSKKLREHFVYPIVAEGTWVDCKFTGEAHNIRDNYYFNRRQFLANWNNGEMSAHFMMRERYDEREEKTLYDALTTLDWRDNHCFYHIEESKNGNTYTIEEYSMKDGQKDGHYKKEYADIHRPYYDWVSCNKPIEEADYKEGKLHGTHKKYNVRRKESTGYGEEKYTSWLESETQYKDGKKHGFEKLYNSDGTVAEMKYWQEGKDCTAKYNKLKKIASKRIDKEKAIEAKTGVKTRLPKMSKGSKIIAMAKETLGLSK
ncbi:MAG: hypothetical protein IJ738_03675 [Alphaproteobacteria bacterium]|nr:hypothetical protein [Alphaproteobacteria bacterium]